MQSLVFNFIKIYNILYRYSFFLNNKNTYNRIRNAKILFVNHKRIYCIYNDYY